MSERSERNEIDRAATRDERSAAETIRGQLLERDVLLAGDETAEQLADLLTAVQRFERAVAVLGGDSMTNALDSNDVDDPDFVLPRRRDDEDVAHYTARVSAAASRLRRDAL
jgi:hypothetical protein